MIEARNSSIQWLHANIGPQFWLWFKDLLEDGNTKHRVQLEAANTFVGFSGSKSLLKNLSHLGAIRIPPGAKLIHGGSSNHLLFVDNVTSNTYLDPGNSLYKKVWVASWPEGQAMLGISNENTIGDLVEAFFGYHWFSVIAGPNTLSGLAKEFVEHLERTCFWSYFTAWD